MKDAAATMTTRAVANIPCYALVNRFKPKMGQVAQSRFLYTRYPIHTKKKLFIHVCGIQFCRKSQRNGSVRMPTTGCLCRKHARHAHHSVAYANLAASVTICTTPASG